VETLIVPLFGRPSTIELAREEAEQLTATFGPSRAYEIARTRTREQMLGRQFNRPKAHWSRVKREIATLTNRSPVLDTATRYLEDHDYRKADAGRQLKTGERLDDEAATQQPSNLRPQLRTSQPRCFRWEVGFGSPLGAAGVLA